MPELAVGLGLSSGMQGQPHPSVGFGGGYHGTVRWTDLRTLTSRDRILMVGV